MPVCKLGVGAIKQIGKSGVKSCERWIWHQMGPQPAGKSDTSEHWVWRAYSGKERRTDDVCVAHIVKATVWIGYGLIRIDAHSQHTGFMMSCAKTIAAAGAVSIRGFKRQNCREQTGVDTTANYQSILNNVDLLAAGEDTRHIVRGRIHCIPQFEIATGRLKIDEGTTGLKFIIPLWIQV